MRRVLFAVFGTIAGLVGLLSYKTHSTTITGSSLAVGTTDRGSAGAGPASSASAPAATTPSTSTTSSGPTSSASASSSAATSTRTVTGNSVDTRWGPVQVKITVTNGKIVSATAVDYPQNNGRDQQINSYAIPTLEKESIGKTTSDIDMVSGATYTSGGYIQSLQSALDKL